MRSSRAERRLTAALLFSAELTAGSLRPDELDRRELGRATALRRRLAPSTRLLERLAMKLGLLGYERNCLRPVRRARGAVLGPEGEGAPRLLVRVDEFPHYRAWDEPGRFGTEGFRHFHEIMRAAGVPYLVATLPRLARNPLDPGEDAERELDDSELAMLAELRRDGVSFGLHGRCHRTRLAGPRRRSELAGLDDEALADLLDYGEAVLAGLGIETPVFVPPFNRFDARQYPLLARRYDVVCGGPETVSVLGFRRTPVALRGGIYLPSYPPLYGRAADLLPAVRRLAELRASVWVPVVLHWGWELEAGRSDLERLAGELALYAVDWKTFLAETQAAMTAAGEAQS